jgi:hypothetical protein
MKIRISYEGYNDGRPVIPVRSSSRGDDPRRLAAGERGVETSETKWQVAGHQPETGRS